MAVADDEEIAEQLAERDQPAVGERLSDWSPEYGALVKVYDRVGELITALVAVNGQQPPSIRPHPRPITAVDRARARRRESKHRALVARVVRTQPAD